MNDIREKIGIDKGVGETGRIKGMEERERESKN